MLHGAKALSSLKLPFYDPQVITGHSKRDQYGQDLTQLQRVTVVAGGRLSVPPKQEESCASLAAWISALPCLECVAVKGADELNSDFPVLLLGKASRLKKIDFSCDLDKASWAALAAGPSAGQVEVLRFRGLPSSDTE